MSQQNQGKPCSGNLIEYKASARSFEGNDRADGPKVIYLVATCVLPNATPGHIQIYFQRENGLKWTLMQTEPGVEPLVVYPIASTTTLEPLVNPPKTVYVTDGHGEHAVTVEPWNNLAV